MLYEAKQGTKAYKYIKSILDEEFEEHQAYMKRVEEVVGFEFEKYQGYQPNRSLLREYEITAIWIPSERFATLDKKVWRKVDSKMLEDGYYVAVAPNKRYKQGKAVKGIHYDSQDNPILAYRVDKRHSLLFGLIHYWDYGAYNLCPDYLFSSIDKAEEAILKVDKSRRVTIILYK